MTAHKQELDRYRTLVETVPDGVYILDSDSCFTSVNEGMVNLTGYSRNELLGSSVSLILEDEIMGNVKERREYLKEHPDDILTTQYDVHTKSGGTVPVEVRFKPLDFEAEFRGTAGVIRDISKRLERQRELQRQRDELDDLNRINAVIRDIDQALVSATTREEIEQAVCDRLAEADPYLFAWIGEYSSGYDRITPRTWAGIESGYFDNVLGADDDRPVEHKPGARALRSRTVQTVQHIEGEATFAPWRADAHRQGYESAASIPLVYNDVEYGVLAVYSGRADAFNDRETAVLGELGETISHAIAAIEREEREQTLTTLHESTRELLHTETQMEISDIVVETAITDLNLSGAVLYCFDETENTLFVESVAGNLPGDSDRYPRLHPGDKSPLWVGFVAGESAVVDDLHELPLPIDSSPMQSAMVIPLGEHGVLLITSGTAGAFNQNTQKLVELVAATAEAAFDRIESEAELRERDRALQEQNQQLTRLNNLNELIRAVDQALVRATTREEIGQVVCDRLTASDRFQFAWIGEHDRSNEQVIPRAWSGAGRGYLDSVSFQTDTETAEPAATTALTDDVTVVPNVAAGLRTAPWRSEAFSREFQSAISVPLTYGDYSYGVLTVYAAEAGLIDEMGEAVLAELGQTVANAINAVETKEALLTDTVVELDFRLHGDTQSFLPRLALELASEVDFVGTVPLSEDSARIFFTVHITPPESVRTVLEELVTVESYRLVAENDDECLFEVTTSGPSIASTLVEHGAAPQKITVSDGVVHVIIELPQSADVRGFVEMFQAEYTGVEFVARRDRNRPMQTQQEFRKELEESLTERQLEVLKTAFYSGYFESPRDSTGEDLADALGVSSSTITGHIRAAQRKLLSLVFTE